MKVVEPGRLDSGQKKLGRREKKTKQVEPGRDKDEIESTLGLKDEAAAQTDRQQLDRASKKM